MTRYGYKRLILDDLPGRDEEPAEFGGRVVGVIQPAPLTAFQEKHGAPPQATLVVEYELPD
jgi:hypothetical protein